MKFWDEITIDWRKCKYISKEYDDEWETGRHRLIDENENIFTSNMSISVANPKKKYYLTREDAR